MSRLEVVLQSGIDVEPPDAVFFASEFDKAWEYGDWPKLMLALDTKCLRSTCRQEAADISADELALLKETFPLVLHWQDGKRLWLTRLPEGDPRIATDYEVAYAFWLPERQLEALRAIFLFVRPEDSRPVRALVAQVEESRATKSKGDPLRGTACFLTP
jgi:hypothetical protein